MSLRHRLGATLRGLRDRLEPPEPPPSAGHGLAPEDVRLDARHVLDRQGVGVEIAFVDVRPRPVPGLPGALHLPDVVARRAELPDAEALVLVCEDGTHATEVALRLRDHDVPAFALDGGLAAWRRAGGEVEPA